MKSVETSLAPSTSTACARPPDWYALLTSGAAGEADRREWQAWLAQSTAHRQAWAGVESINRQFGMLTGSGEARQATASALDASRASARSRRRMLRGLLLAGGVFGLAAGANRIAPDARRPMLVETEQGVLRPLGTRFDVRQGDASTQLAVLEGRVEVRLHAGNDAPRVIEAGQQVRFDSRIGPVEPAPPGLDA